MRHPTTPFRRQAMVDVLCTVVGSVGLGVTLVHFGKTSAWGSVAAIASGLTLVSVAVVTMVRRNPCSPPWPTVSP